MPKHLDPGTCRSCGASIYWAKSHNNRPMPLDAKSEKGIVIRDDGLAYVEDVYTSHFRTCPKADLHRRARS